MSHSPSIDVHALLGDMKVQARKMRVRISSILSDYDRLRKGHISKAKLRTALDEASHRLVDYMSLDTQGSEEVVLKTVELERLDLVLVEDRPC